MKRIYVYNLCLFFQNASWLVPKHSGANYPIYITWSQRDGDNVSKITKCLTVDWDKILSTQLHHTEAIGSRYSLVKLDMCILEWTSKVSRFCLHNFNRRTIKELLFRTISFQYFHTLNVNLHVSQMKSRAHDNDRFPFLPCRYNRAWKSISALWSHSYHCFTAQQKNFVTSPTQKALFTS